MTSVRGAIVMIVALTALTTALACARTSQVERLHKLRPSSAIDSARQILRNYANGAPVTSEVTSFDSIVDSVRAEDEATATLLADAFKKIQENPASRTKVAKETLAKLPQKPEPEAPATDSPPPE